MLRPQTVYAPGVDRSHQVLVHLVLGVLLALDDLGEAQSAATVAVNAKTLR